MHDRPRDWSKLAAAGATNQVFDSVRWQARLDTAREHKVHRPLKGQGQDQAQEKMESGESRDEISLTRSAHQKINTIFQLSIMVRLRIRL